MLSGTDAHEVVHKSRKQVTVLFADIVRSSDIIREFDPETAESIFNQVIAGQVEIIKKFHGTVNQVMGDGIMCLFGAEPPFEEHPLRAVSAGQEMLRGILEVQKQYRNIPIKIRIGINTGNVVINRLKNDHYRALFQTTGETVHIADRVLRKAGPDRMLVSQSSRDFLDRYYHFRKAGSLNWRQNAEPLHVYEPVALKAEKVRQDAQPEKTHIPRDNIQNRMVALVHSAREKKKPGIIWIYGAPGIGKTHLVSHFIPEYYKDYFDKIIQVNFFPDPVSGDNAAFEQVVLKEVFGGGKRSIYKGIARDSANTERKDMPFFDDCVRDILRLKNIGAHYLSLDAATRARFRTGAMAHILLTASGDRKILLILEDMHWAKESALAYIEALFTFCQGHEQLLVIATSRKEPCFCRAITETKIKKILLDPLTPQEGMNLLHKADSKKTHSLPLKRKIYQLSGGNPYFIREYFRWTHSLISQGSARKAVKESLDRHTPEKIIDILYNKLAVMGEEPVRLAKISAILGMNIDFDILQAVCGAPRKEILALLLKLEQADIIRRNRLFPNPEWVFTHELLQKVIYDSIPRLMRASWHKAVVGQLKKTKFRTLDNRHMIMAVHAGRGGDNLAQYIYSKWAAREASILSLHGSSIAFSKSSRKLLGGLRGISGRGRHEIRARLLEINSLFILGKYSVVRQHVEYMLGKKDVLVRLGYLERVLSFKELYLWIKGDLTGAAKISRKILSMKAGRIPNEIYVRENSRLANLYIDLGRYERAILHDLNVVKIIPDKDFDKRFDLLVQAKPAALSSLALSYAETGNIRKSLECFEQACHFLEKSDDCFTRIYILVYLANSLLAQDKNREASKLLETAREYCETTGAALLKPYVLSALGVALGRTGKSEEGIRLCGKALTLAASGKLALRTSQFEIWHAELLMIRGEYSPAIRNLEKIVKLTRACDEMGRLASAYYLLGRCYMEKRGVTGNDQQYAETCLHHALRISRKFRMRTLENKIRILFRRKPHGQRVRIFFE
ncbi:MAG: adenylate/guanylate cyclase domain-containing protein [Pseudomonadota bacterium]